MPLLTFLANRAVTEMSLLRISWDEMFHIQAANVVLERCRSLQMIKHIAHRAKKVIVDPR